jgi:hypothetical protein
MPVATPKTIAGYPVLDVTSLGVPTTQTFDAETKPASVTPVSLQDASDAFSSLRDDAVVAPQSQRRATSYFGGTYNNGHGQDGYIIEAPFDANHSTFLVVHSVWTPGTDVILNQPASNGNPYYLYAPTTHPPNSCIEAGVAYMTFPSGGGTLSYIYFYDFCKNGGSFAWFANDAAFRSRYVFQDADTKAPSMAVLITTLNSPLSAPDWRAYVLNSTSHSWDLFYQSLYANRTSTPPWYGWSIFEPNFQAQPMGQFCRQPRLPAFYANDLEFYNFANGNQSVLDASTAFRTLGGACVSADATGQASFAFGVDVPNWRWHESATGW